MLGQVFTSPGYHTRLSSGAWVHPTVPSLEYAILLLRHGPAGMTSRAEAILDKVVSLQLTDPVNVWCGVWPYLLEEPISSMDTPDGNWALFCGARVAEALVAGRAHFSSEFTARLETALMHSGMFAYRRNILPGYTNIAVMGGGVAAMAGELLGFRPLLEYGRRRLESVVRSVEANGTLCEYNSLPYNLIAIHECERVLFLLKDKAIREFAEAIRVAAWKMLADIFHPETQMFSGPQSRAYADFPDALTVEKLSERLGFQLTCKTTEEHTLWTGPIDLTLVPLPCPAEQAARFLKLPADPLETKQNYVRRTGDATTAGTTWFQGEATLGSATRENFFYQRRPVLAYWQTPEDAAVVLKLQFRCNGRPFTSAYSYNRQSGGAVLSAVALIENLGYHTPHMDIPRDAIFQISDLRLRYVLAGRGVRVAADAQGRFVLTAGVRQAVIYPLPGQIDDLSIAWETGGDGDSVWVDGILYAGAERQFAFRQIQDVEVAAGLLLLSAGAEIPEAFPTVAGRTPEHTSFYWNVAGKELKMDVPRTAVEYLWATGLVHR